MNIPAHSHLIPHLHVPTDLHFIVPHTVDLPGWWWMGGFMLVPWTCFAVFLLWFYRNARKEEELRIQRIEDVLS